MLAGESLSEAGQPSLEARSPQDEGIRVHWGIVGCLLSPHLAGWTPFWNHHQSAAADPPSHLSQQRGRAAHGGTAILVRTSLLSSRGGPLSVEDATRSPDGRLVSVRVRWGGHTFRLASLYMPNAAPQQAAFIRASLRPLGAQAPLIWGGDFNFVEQMQLDRSMQPSGPGDAPPAAQGAPPRRQQHRNEGVARMWQEHLPDLVDVFRHCHPTATSYTHFGPGSAARLDRFYASSSLLPFCMGSQSTPEIEIGPSMCASQPHRLFS